MNSHYEQIILDNDPPQAFANDNAYHFDDIGLYRKLALVTASDAWAWVAPAISVFPSLAIVRVELLAEPGTEICGIPEDVWAVIREHYRLDFSYDILDGLHRAEAIAEAKVVFDRFLNGDHRPFTSSRPCGSQEIERAANQVVKRAA